MSNEIATDYEGRIVERVIDRGDGTGVRTVYDPSSGDVLDTFDLTGLPIPEPALPTHEERIAALQAQVDELTAIIAGE